MTYLSYLDENSDITDITWRNRRRFAPLDTFCEDIMRGASELSTAEKELIAAYVSGLNACQFCFGSHQAVSANFGVEAEIIEQLVADIDSTKFSEKLKVILRFAKKAYPGTEQSRQDRCRRDIEPRLERTNRRRCYSCRWLI